MPTRRRCGFIFSGVLLCRSLSEQAACTGVVRALSVSTCISIAAAERAAPTWCCGAQLEERRRRSLADGAGPSTACHAEAEAEGACDTELIFKLERQGEGWGEEILPRLSVEQRPLARLRVRNRSALPDPWAVRSCPGRPPPPALPPCTRAVLALPG